MAWQRWGRRRPRRRRQTQMQGQARSQAAEAVAAAAPHRMTKRRSVEEAGMGRAPPPRQIALPHLSPVSARLGWSQERGRGRASAPGETPRPSNLNFQRTGERGAAAEGAPARAGAKRKRHLRIDQPKNAWRGGCPAQPWSRGRARNRWAPRPEDGESARRPLERGRAQRGGTPPSPARPPSCGRSPSPGPPSSQR